MEFSKVITERYSCKKFDSSKNVSKDVLESILKASLAAPTAKNLQEHKIYVIESKDILAKIDKVTPCRYGANTMLLVCFDKNNVFTYPGTNRTSGVEDATIVATHLVLAAANECVDSCWINNFNPNELHEVLNLPENEEILMLLDLGYAAQGTGPLPNHHNRKSLEETVVYV